MLCRCMQKSSMFCLCICVDNLVWYLGSESAKIIVMQNGCQYDVILFIGGSYGSMAATRYCMTVTEVGGNFLSIGENHTNETDTRFVNAFFRHTFS